MSFWRGWWRRFFHGLVYIMHQDIDVYDDYERYGGRIIRLGCSCGKVFWKKEDDG